MCSILIGQIVKMADLFCTRYMYGFINECMEQTYLMICHVSVYMYINVIYEQNCYVQWFKDFEVLFNLDTNYLRIFEGLKQLYSGHNIVPINVLMCMLQWWYKL